MIIKGKSRRLSRDCPALSLAVGRYAAPAPRLLLNCHCAQREASEQDCRERQADPPCGLYVFHGGLAADDPIDHPTATHEHHGNPNQNRTDMAVLLSYAPSSKRTQRPAGRFRRAKKGEPRMSTMTTGARCLPLKRSLSCGWKDRHTDIQNNTRRLRVVPEVGRACRITFGIVSVRKGVAPLISALPAALSTKRYRALSDGHPAQFFSPRIAQSAIEFGRTNLDCGPSACCSGGGRARNERRCRRGQQG